MKMPSLSGREVEIAFGSAVLALIVVSAISYRGTLVASQSEGRVRHTHEVLENLAESLSAMQNVESSYRGFVLTGKESYLESYRFSIARGERARAAVLNLTVDNPVQQRRLPALESLAVQKIQFGDSVIGLRKSSGLEVAAKAIENGPGQPIADAFEEISHAMQEEELRLLARREADAKRRRLQNETALLLGTLVGLSIVAIVGRGALREGSQRELVQAMLRSSEEKLRVLQLVEMEGRYRGLLEAAPDAMVIADAEGRIVLINAQTELLFGYTRDELVGQLVEILVPEPFRARYPRFRRGYTTNPRTRPMSESLELRGLRKDASEFPIEIMLSQRESPDGLLVTAAIRDISVRAAAERDLEQVGRELSVKHRLLDSVVEGTTDLIYIRDLEDRFTLANGACAKLFGRSVSEMAGISMRELLLKDRYEIIAQSDREIVRTGSSRTTEEVAEIDGVARLFLTTKGPYRDADQKIIGTIGISREITERKRAEEHLVKTVGELKRSNDELEQFAYVASHDLQEPLRMVSSYTQLLAERYRGRLDSDADEFIAYAVDGCDRMKGMIQALLAYSRAGTDGAPLREISSENALNRALTNLRATIEENSAVVTHDALPSITADETQLAQVFQNLVGNAVKYRSAKAPQVHIAATNKSGKEWIFSVRDNGLGIAPQYFQRIFVLFQRLHGTRDSEGTGIGLAICKKMVERLGGRIWVDSQLENGSTFYFALPGIEGK
jgi:PAS domain S-box-containing protein